MGLFDVTVKLANLAVPGRTEEVSLLVDTGTTLSCFVVDPVAKKLMAPSLLALCKVRVDREVHLMCDRNLSGTEQFGEFKRIYQ